MDKVKTPRFVPSMRLRDALDAMAAANVALATQTAKFKAANDSLETFLRRDPPRREFFQTSRAYSSR